MILKLFSNNIEKYFLTKESLIKTNKKVDLILSPEFYWIRVFEIPQDSVKKATKLLPTLFEDILPHNEFDYSCIQKSENVYISFAFNTKEILTYIKRSGLTVHQINSIYFAQTQMAEYTSFILDNEGYLYEKEILIKVPKSFCENAEVLSKKIVNNVIDKPIVIKFYSNIVSGKYINIFCILLAFVMVLNIFKYSVYKMKIDDNNKTTQTIKTKNRLPKTSLQMNSILKNMKIQKGTNKKFKEALYFILSYKNSIREGTIEKISFQNQKFIIIFKSIDNKRIQKYIQSKLKIISSRAKRDYVRMELSL